MTAANGAPLNRATLSRFNSAPGLEVAGTPVRYEVTMEPNNRPWLLLMDAAPRAPELPEMKAGMTNELQWFVNRPLTDITRYSVESYTTFRHGAQLQARQLLDYVALPRGFNPRTLQLAADMRRDPRYAQADAATLADALMERLRTGGYTYTLEPGVSGPHAADEFWFDTKLGFCEHIASAFVVLMRAMDVPARVVTGYQGGERNSVDGYWTVRQSDAHAWAEVWQSGRGWLRVDPTSAVAPGRTGAAQRLQAPQGAMASAFTGALGTFSPTLLANARAAWEALNNAWNQRVLNYTQSRQFDLLKALGFRSPSWEDLSYVLIAIVVAVSLTGAGWAMWNAPSTTPGCACCNACAGACLTPGSRCPPPARRARWPRKCSNVMARPPPPCTTGCCAWKPSATPATRPPASLHSAGNTTNWPGPIEIAQCPARHPAAPCFVSYILCSYLCPSDGG